MQNISNDIIKKSNKIFKELSELTKTIQEQYYKVFPLAKQIIDYNVKIYFLNYFYENIDQIQDEEIIKFFENQNEVFQSKTEKMNEVVENSIKEEELLLLEYDKLYNIVANLYDLNIYACANNLNFNENINKLLRDINFLIMKFNNINTNLSQYEYFKYLFIDVKLSDLQSNSEYNSMQYRLSNEASKTSKNQKNEISALQTKLSNTKKKFLNSKERLYPNYCLYTNFSYDINDWGRHLHSINNGNINHLSNPINNFISNLQLLKVELNKFYNNEKFKRRISFYNNNMQNILNSNQNTSEEPLVGHNIKHEFTIENKEVINYSTINKINPTTLVNDNEVQKDKITKILINTNSKNNKYNKNIDTNINNNTEKALYTNNNIPTKINDNLSKDLSINNNKIKKIIQNNNNGDGNYINKNMSSIDTDKINNNLSNDSEILDTLIDEDIGSTDFFGDTENFLPNNNVNDEFFNRTTLDNNKNLTDSVDNNINNIYNLLDDNKKKIRKIGAHSGVLTENKKKYIDSQKLNLYKIKQEKINKKLIKKNLKKQKSIDDNIYLNNNDFSIAQKILFSKITNININNILTEVGVEELFSIYKFSRTYAVNNIISLDSLFIDNTFQTENNISNFEEMLKKIDNKNIDDFFKSSKFQRDIDKFSQIIRTEPIEIAYTLQNTLMQDFLTIKSDYYKNLSNNLNNYNEVNNDLFLSAILNLETSMNILEYTEKEYYNYFSSIEDYIDTFYKSHHAILILNKLNFTDFLEASIIINYLNRKLSSNKNKNESNNNNQYINKDFLDSILFLTIPEKSYQSFFNNKKDIKNNYRSINKYIESSGFKYDYVYITEIYDKYNKQLQELEKVLNNDNNDNIKQFVLFNAHLNVMYRVSNALKETIEINSSLFHATLLSIISVDFYVNIEKKYNINLFEVNDDDDDLKKTYLNNIKALYKLFGNINTMKIHLLIYMKENLILQNIAKNIIKIEEENYGSPTNFTTEIPKDNAYRENINKTLSSTFNKDDIKTKQFAVYSDKVTNVEKPLNEIEDSSIDKLDTLKISLDLIEYINNLPPINKGYSDTKKLKFTSDIMQKYSISKENLIKDFNNNNNNNNKTQNYKPKER